MWRYAKAINEAIHQQMADDPSVFVLGQGVKSPWYVGSTADGLLERFGPELVIDTPVSENAITGAAVGAAIVGMRPIVNRSEIQWNEASEEPLTLLKSELDLPPDAAPQQVLVAASQRLVDLERESKQRHVEERIREAMRAGKLVEAQRAWAEALVAQEGELFDEWLRTAPVVVQPGVTTPPTEPGGSERRQHAIAARARSEFRANAMLADLTTEEAYVADAVRRDHK